MRMLRCILAVLVCAASVVSAQKPIVGIQEKLGQTIPMDVLLFDEQGNSVRVGDLVDKPTIFTFVYYRCPGICTPLLNELSKVVDKMGMEPGTDYRIITVSFDPSETPAMALEKQQNYLSGLKREIPPSAWRFMTGDSESVSRLANGAGFYFERQGEDWLHAGALIITSPYGKITRYINGTEYLPFDVKMALLEAAEGTVTPTTAKLLRFCFSYDPEGRTYALNVLRISAVLIMGFAGTFALVMFVRPGAKKKTLQVKEG